MGKFSDLPHFLLEEYFNQSLSLGERNNNISGPYHRYYQTRNDGGKIIFDDHGNILYNTEGHIVYDDEDKVGSYLHGNRRSIIADGGYWTRLWIKVVDILGEEPECPGFVEFKFRFNRNYLEGDSFILEKGSMLTAAASVNSMEFTSGSEVYFKKGTYLYEWLLKNSTDYRDYFNTNKTFLYFGKIYTHRDQTDTYHIQFDGMKNYVMKALPRENRTDNLTEFSRLYFDKVYQKIYNKMKDVPSLIDPKEIDIRFINYISKAYSIDTDINLSERALREWVENLVYILKRKGTYASLYIIWKTFLKNTLNNINIFDRWHNNPNVFVNDPDIPLGNFADILHQMNYGIVPEGCSGHYWYDKILHAISPGVIFIQNTPSTTWYIAHTMYTKDVFVQCFNTLFDRIFPISVIPLSTGMVKVTFNEEIYGYAYLMRKGDFTHYQVIVDDTWTIAHNLGQKEVLTQFKDVDLKKIMPDSVKLNDVFGTLATFGEDQAGRANIVNRTLDENFVVVESNVIPSNEWACNHDLGNLGTLTGDNIGVFVQCYDTNDEMIQPYSLTLNDQNNCTIKFEESVSGYAVIKASESNDVILPDYDLNDMILSPHYKIEVDLSCEPIDDDDNYILDQETIERLMTNWEIMRPVSRFSHYHLLIAPITDFTGEYRSLYGPGYNASLYTKFVVSAGELLPVANAETLYFKQYVNKKVWKITHTLDSDDFIVQCYDSENNRIWPDEIKTIGNNNLEISFKHSVNGAAALIEPVMDSSPPSGYVGYFPTKYESEWDVQHNLGNLEVLNQFDDYATRTKIVPSGVILRDDEDGSYSALALWESANSDLGYSLSSAVSYVHTELTPSTTWTMNHNLSSNSVIAQFFDNDNIMITPVSLTINNSDYCTASFATSATSGSAESVSGYAIIRPVYKKITEADIMQALQDHGYWELGSGTSGVNYDPLISHGVESILTSGGINDYSSVSTSGGLTAYGYSEDNIYHYLSNEVSDLDAGVEDWEVTEIAWLTIIDGVRKIRFYSYFDPIYKPSNMYFNTHTRIEKGQA